LRCRFAIIWHIVVRIIWHIFMLEGLPPAKGRWERLQLADVYLIRPDGSGLRRISEHGGFCGSPKWTPDSKSVVAYCMAAQETFDYRSAAQDGDDKLLRIDNHPTILQPARQIMSTEVCQIISQATSGLRSNALFGRSADSPRSEVKTIQSLEDQDGM
jgi:Tol biopolymer transport system component